MNTWELSINKSSSDSKLDDLMYQLNDKVESYMEDTSGFNNEFTIPYYQAVLHVLNGDYLDASPDQISELAKLELNNATERQIADMDSWDKILNGFAKLF